VRITCSLPPPALSPSGTGCESVKVGSTKPGLIVLRFEDEEGNELCVRMDPQQGEFLRQLLEEHQYNRINRVQP